jgi:hypothetical protein
MTSRLLRPLAAVASLAIGLALAEAALHLLRPEVAYSYAPQHISLSHFQKSSYLPFELRPNHVGQFRMSEFDTTVRTNELGMRDGAIRGDRPRILCLGDSFTFGFGVQGPETFCAQLERVFQDKYDVINAGFAGGNAPDTYGLWLARHREALAPRAIVVSVFQNDYDDVASHEWLPDGAMPPERISQPGTVVTPDGEWMRDGALTRLPSWMRQLLKQSYVVAVVRDRWLDDAGAAPAAIGLPNSSPALPASDARFSSALELLRNAAGNTPLVVHLIPLKGQQETSRMDTLVGKFAAQYAVPLVQRYSLLSESDYFGQDGHWVVSGHTKAAGYLHTALVTLGY